MIVFIGTPLGQYGTYLPYFKANSNTTCLYRLAVYARKLTKTGRLSKHYSFSVLDGSRPGEASEYIWDSPTAFMPYSVNYGLYKRLELFE